MELQLHPPDWISLSRMTRDIGARISLKLLRNGTMPEARLDDMITRQVHALLNGDEQAAHMILDAILRLMAAILLPGTGESISLPWDRYAGRPHCSAHTAIDARNPSSKAILRAGAVEGHVLVKAPR